MRYVLVNGVCEYIGKEVEGRKVVKHEEEYFTVPDSMVVFQCQVNEEDLHNHTAKDLVVDAYIDTLPVRRP
jgi:hypothetical protein